MMLKGPITRVLSMIFLILLLLVLMDFTPFFDTFSAGLRRSAMPVRNGLISESQSDDDDDDDEGIFTKIERPRRQR